MLWLKEMEKMLQDWKRGVPFGDMIGDRWERARMLGFGEKSSIYDSALVLGDIQVGENTWIGPFTVLDGSGGLCIGSCCSISAGVQIYTVEWALSGGVKEPSRAPAIGNRCLYWAQCNYRQGGEYRGWLRDRCKQCCQPRHSKWHEGMGHTSQITGQGGKGIEVNVA